MSQFDAKNDKKVRQETVVNPLTLPLNPNSVKNQVTFVSDNATGSLTITGLARLASAGEEETVFESDQTTALVINFANGLVQTVDIPLGMKSVLATPTIALLGSFYEMRGSGAED